MESRPEYPKVVSFDCAQTLLEVDWSIRRYVADVCAEANLELPLHGPAVYEQMYYDRLPEYIRVNMERDHDRCDAWWVQLGRDWLTVIGSDPREAERLQAISRRLGFGEDSILFKLFDDVLPALDKLESLGIRSAVLSNWDYSLHRALEGAGIYGRFDLIVASLEYGVEKPDPGLFQTIIDHFAVQPSEVLHIGDNVVDDFEGARAVGMRAALLDRSRPVTEQPVLHHLNQIEEALRWS